MAKLCETANNQGFGGILQGLKYRLPLATQKNKKQKNKKKNKVSTITIEFRNGRN
jgi:hypothetical protein